MPTIDPEDSIVHFTYDALGRLIAKQAPWPLVAGEIRTEIYLHDGVRRIQEIWRQPAQGNGSQGGQNQNNQGPPTYVDITEREYIHSPGYVDEFVCEIITDGPDTFWWVLQDPNYNVVALVSDGDGSLNRGEVARQYSWSPYGELLRADIYDTSAPMSRLGHQGLFHDRLDADILSEPMEAFSQQSVQNRDRTLLPWLGRFAQADPNGFGSPVIAELAQMGRPLGVLPLEPEVELIFADGMSLQQYIASSPTGATDPSGRFIMGMMFGMGEAGSINADYNDTAMEAARTIGSMLSGMLDDYGFNQMADMEAILDWSVGDDYFDGYTIGGERIVTDSGWQMAGRKRNWFRDLTPLAGTHGHHLIPKFMRGLRNGLEYPLSQAEHLSTLHVTLNRHLRNATPPFPAMNQPRQWDTLMNTITRDDVRRLRRTLVNATREFDDVTRHNMTPHLLREIRRQRWLQ